MRQTDYTRRSAIKVTEGRPLSEAEEFARTGYLVVRSAIPDSERRFLFNYVVAKFGKLVATEGDHQVPGTPFAYADFAGESLLKRVQPLLESNTGVALYPTYSYLRLYKHGDTLKKHRDRPACEISATLCLGYVPDQPWPVWVESLGNPAAVSLLAGDMLIYRGMDIPHWREAYAGERLAQIFLHYVDQNGPHRDWKFDRRAALHTPPASRRDQLRAPEY